MDAGSTLGNPAIANYGAFATSNNAATNYGLYATVNAGSTACYGVYAEAPSNGTLNGSNGIWTNNTGWAVWSNGAQFSSTHALWSTSDMRLKKDIEPLKAALETILGLSPKTYRYDLSLHPGFNLPPGTQIGLISQDVEKVIPGLVMDTQAPDQFDKEGKLVSAGFEFKAMNYMGLIPVLIGAVKEQQAIIEELGSRLERLENNGASPEGKAVAPATTRAMLYQNEPNPFNQTTVVRYQLPNGSVKAALEVYAANGQLVQRFDGLSAGEGRIMIAAGALRAGTYNYTLVVDGSRLETRTMVITD